LGAVGGEVAGDGRQGEVGDGQFEGGEQRGQREHGEPEPPPPLSPPRCRGVGSGHDGKSQTSTIIEVKG
jgi:hypothetical protein